MSPIIDRRTFNSRASSAIGGLAVTPFLIDGQVFAEERDPAEKRLVLLGLNALARAHKLNYFADGHRGGALISAHLLCRENDLTAPARSRIEQLFDLNWGKAKLCQPFPKTDPDPAQVRRIGVALAEGGPVLRQVGHDAIFAMLAIKGFRMLPQAATPERIDGVCKLIRSMKPWRDVDPDPEVKPPPFTDVKAASRFVLREASDAVDRFIGYGQGFAGHMLTFGQALIELAAMGDVEWAESCRTAFRKYVTVTRLGPKPDDKRYRERPRSKLRPDAADYWRRRGDKTLGIGHVFKYPYSYYDLLRAADDPALQREWESKAYRIF